MASVGERIRTRRTELDWTQDELARRAGISKSFLSDLENDRRSVSAANLLEIAKVLGLSMDFLMTGVPRGEQDVAPAQEVPALDLSIPAGLSELARVEGLSFRVIEQLLGMRQQIVANRSSAQSRQGDFDWRKFYESVKDYL